MITNTVNYQTQEEFHIDIRKQYWWLNIPVLSWIGLVFPLILPPIPIGPVVVSLSWNRREWMSHLRRGMSSIGRKRKEYTFPVGWFVNVGANIIDMTTLGLSHLFITAELLSAMIKQNGSEEERAEIDPVLWILKWLVLGNIVFLTAYIVYPGFIFGKLLTRFERHLYIQYKPAKGSVKSATSPELQVAYKSTTTFNELAQISRQAPVLLFAEHVPIETETTALQVFRRTLENLAANIIDQGVAVRWCNMNQSAPSRYHDIAKHLKQMNLDERGWTLFDNAEVVAHRSAELVPDEKKLANLARETLGLPRAVVVSQSRIGSPDCKVTSLEQIMRKSMASPVILIVFSSPSKQEAVVTLDIRNNLLPKIRPWLETSNSSICLANTNRKANNPIRDQLNEIQKKFKGAMLFRNGQTKEYKKFGAFSDWKEYANEIKKWLADTKPATIATGSTEINYFIVDSLQEARNLSYQQPAVLLIGQFGQQTDELKEFTENILPDIWSEAQGKASILCYGSAKNLSSQSQSDLQELPASGVVLFRNGNIVVNEEVKPCPGSAVKYVSTVREILQTLHPAVYESAPAVKYGT